MKCLYWYFTSNNQLCFSFQINFDRLQKEWAPEKIPTGKSSWQTEVAEATESISETSEESINTCL